MKTRYKKAKKILTFYYNHFGLKAPYNVLVCGTFCKQALTDKINIAEQLPKYLSGEVKLLTTRCAIKECELGGSLLYGPLKVLSQYDVVDCAHSWFKGSAKCLRKMALKDKNNFIVATQDTELADSLQEQNVPLLHIAYNAINLKPPSDSSRNFAEEKTSKKLTLSKKQETNLAKLREEFGIPQEEVIKKKKKKKGVNPLSCKKKKKKPASQLNKVQDSGLTKTRRRKKKKLHIPSHMKEQLTIHS